MQYPKTKEIAVTMVPSSHIQDMTETLTWVSVS